MNERELIDAINVAAYEVRLNLTRGYLEEVYHEALMVELQSRGIKAIKDAPVPVYYKGHLIKGYKADILVEDRIILELKAVDYVLPIHEAQLVNYLTATGLDKGILINYGGEKFAFRVKDRIYRR